MYRSTRSLGYPGIFSVLHSSRSTMFHVFLQIIFVITIHEIAADEAERENLDSIFLRFYNGTTLDEHIDFFLDDINTLQTELIKDRPTVLYIHGFMEYVEKESVRTVVQAYLKRNDHNILAIDYSKIANDSYPRVTKNAKIVGNVVAIALDKLVESGFDPTKLHIVGHSMGGQVAGFIGRKVNFRIPRITGLDPAGPLFNFINPRLSSVDANFVDIIHTDAGFYGNARKTGTVDFFPNGGQRVQPGCPQNFTFYSVEEFCSHSRSWRYYAESVTNETAFLGVQCSSRYNFYSGDCNDNPQVVMGYGTRSNANGSVYLLTNAQSPFGLRARGAEIIPA